MTSRSARAIPGPALARDVVTARDVDDEDLHVGERGAEDRGEVVAAALDEHEVERALVALELLDGLEVDRDVVADRGVRAAAGLHGDDPLGRQDAGRAQELRVLGRVDVVRHDADARVVAQLAAELGDEAALARPDRPADADPQCALSWQRSAPFARRGRAAASSRPTAAGGACSATGRSSALIARAAASISGVSSATQRAASRGVQAEQLERGAGHGRGVVVERDRRHLGVVQAGGRADDAERDRARGGGRGTR